MEGAKTDTRYWLQNISFFMFFVCHHIVCEVLLP